MGFNNIFSINFQIPTPKSTNRKSLKPRDLRRTYSWWCFPTFTCMLVKWKEYLKLVAQVFIF